MSTPEAITDSAIESALWELTAGDVSIDAAYDLVQARVEQARAEGAAAERAAIKDMINDELGKLAAARRSPEGFEALFHILRRAGLLDGDPA